MTRSEIDILVHSRLFFHLKNKIFCNSSISDQHHYPASWADPTIFYNGDAYQISKSGYIPRIIQEVLSANSGYSTEVRFDPELNLTAIATSKELTVVFNKSNEEMISRSLRLTDISTTGEDDIPHFDIHVGHDKSFSVILVSSDGKIKFTRNIFKESCTNHQLSILPIEKVTFVKLIYADIALIGTSASEIYSFCFAAGKQLSISTFYTHSLSAMPFVKKFLTHYPSLALFDSFAKHSLASGDVIDISKLDEFCYISDKKYIKIWKIDERPTLVYKQYMINDLIENLYHHIPPHIPKDNLLCEIIDVKAVVKNEIIVLVSYSVPDMKDYVQYAITKCIVGYEDDSNIISSIYVKNTVTLPYSVAAAVLTKQPSICVASKLVFVVFNQSVVVVSSEKRSIFEERIDLNGPNDKILHVSVYENIDKSLCSAMVLTLQSGIIKFDIDIAKIQSPDLTNPYSGVVYGTSDRDILLFKANLEKTVFFGTHDTLALKFPIDTDQVSSISAAVKQLSDEILNGGCPLIPVQSDFDIFVVSRYYFLQRIYLVLKENTLEEQLSAEDRIKLMSTAEFCYLAVILDSYLKTKLMTEEDKQRLADIILLLVGSSRNEGDVLEHFLRNHVILIGTLLTRLNLCIALQSADDIIMKVAYEARCFEDEYLEFYDLGGTEFHLISEHLNPLLQSVFERNLQKLKVISDTEETLHINNTWIHSESKRDIITKKLTDCTILLLDTLKANLARDISDNVALQTYKKSSKELVEKLSSVGLHKTAHDIAHQYMTFASIIQDMYRFNLYSAKKKNLQYIELYGSEYFDSLLDYLIQQDEQEELLDICSIFKNFAEDYFNKRLASSVSWKFFLLQKNYERALDTLKSYSKSNLTSFQRNEARSWILLITHAIEESQKGNERCSST